MTYSSLLTVIGAPVTVWVDFVETTDAISWGGWEVEGCDGKGWEGCVCVRVTSKWTSLSAVIVYDESSRESSSALYQGEGCKEGDGVYAALAIDGSSKWWRLDIAKHFN